MKHHKVIRSLIVGLVACLELAGTVSPVHAMNQGTDHVYQSAYHMVLNSSINSANCTDEIFPYSSEGYLDESALYDLTREQIQECINDIYARHGFIFKDADIRAYYEGKSWYRAYSSDAEKVVSTFNSFERANVQLLARYRDRSDYCNGYTNGGPSNYLPNTSTTIIYKSDLYGLSREQIQRLINDIYARHGFIFKDTDIQAYYESQSWYKGCYNNMETVAQSFNTVEHANIATMKSMIK